MGRHGLQLQADVLNSPLVLVARTDAEAATMIDSNIVARLEYGELAKCDDWTAGGWNMTFIK